MLKKFTILLCFCVLLTGCLPLNNLKKEKIVDEEGEETEQAIELPSIKTQETYYRTLKEYEPGAIRDTLPCCVSNRIDVDAMELGLMRLSKEVFPVDSYYFQEGQFITGSILSNWLSRSNAEIKFNVDSPMNMTGLNPAINIEAYTQADGEGKVKIATDNPKYFSFLLEQNYLVETGENSAKLGGISIGLSFNKTFYAEVMHEGLKYTGQVDIDIEKLKAEAYKIGEEVAVRLRQHPKLKDIPIVMGLYLEQPVGSVVPGNYFAKAVLEKGETNPDWKDVNEKYYFFPSDKAEKDHREDWNEFNQFTDEVQEYFPNYIGIIGNALYRDGEMVTLDIEIPMQFKSKAEIISFTQYVNFLVKEKYFTEQFVNVYINSSMDKPESIIISDPSKEEPFVHIY